MKTTQTDEAPHRQNNMWQGGNRQKQPDRNNAQRLADALAIAQRAFTHSPDGMIRFSDPERAQIREALAEWSKSI